MSTPWPWPGDDTPLKRARRIANNLLALLPAAEQQHYSATAHTFGEGWLGERPITYTEDQAITTREAADLVGVTDQVIRQWACMPHPAIPGRPLLPRSGRIGRDMTYLVRNVLDASYEIGRSRRARQGAA